MSGLGRVLASREIVITCGAGGVGKTTTAASAAASAAVHLGAKVLVITVDPAQRLSSALGLSTLGNRETLVDTPSGPGGARGELWAAVLDTEQSWDDLVNRHAPDAATAEAILANPLYRNLASRFVRSHDYIAMERLFEIHTSGRYDLIVVDTPPARAAVDFLEAPARMAEFFSSPLLRWLIAPARSARVGAAISRPFTHLADRLLGASFLEDIAEFFVLFQTMFDGFSERSRAVQKTLADRRTSFVVVSTLEPGPTREALELVGGLGARGLHLGAVVLNKVLPEYLLDADAAVSANRLGADPYAVASSLPGVDASVEDLSRVLGELASSFLDYRVVAQREAEQRGELGRLAGETVTVPFLAQEPTDVPTLLSFARFLSADG